MAMFEGRDNDVSDIAKPARFAGSAGIMTTFDDRERAQEAKYALDQESLFKVTARRNRMLGMWAAEKLGLAGADAEAYAKQVVTADFEESGEDDVFRKVHKDLQGKGVTEAEIRRQMKVLFDKAREQIKSAPASG
jgi:hypothetical protein